MLCWQLPGMMRPTHRQQEDERRLRRLHHIISAGGAFEEPKYHASHNGSLPQTLQKTHHPPLTRCDCNIFARAQNQLTLYTLSTYHAVLSPISHVIFFSR